MDKGTLFGVSVGPGDPELLTLKAVRVIQEADVVAVPVSSGGRTTALDIAREHVGDKPVMRCPTPMSSDPQVLRTTHLAIADQLCAELDQGRNVAYLCLGDVGIYSTFSYVRDLVLECGYQVQTVPGVPSICAAAATTNAALCTGGETLAIVPAASSKLGSMLNLADATVVMKPGRSLEPLRAMLESQGLADDTVVVSRCGMEGERVYRGLDGCPDDLGYFSLALVRPGRDLASSAGTA